MIIQIIFVLYIVDIFVLLSIKDCQRVIENDSQVFQLAPQFLAYAADPIVQR